MNALGLISRVIGIETLRLTYTIDWTWVLFFFYSMCQFNKCNEFMTICLLNYFMMMYECVFNIHVKSRMKTMKNLKNEKSKKRRHYVIANIYILATTMCHRCYTTISNDIFVVANNDVSATIYLLMVLSYCNNDCYY